MSKILDNDYFYDDEDNQFITETALTKHNRTDTSDDPLDPGTSIFARRSTYASKSAKFSKFRSNDQHSAHLLTLHPRINHQHQKKASVSPNQATSQSSFYFQAQLAQSAQTVPTSADCNQMSCLISVNKIRKKIRFWFIYFIFI